MVSVVRVTETQFRFSNPTMVCLNPSMSNSELSNEVSIHPVKFPAAPPPSPAAGLYHVELDDVDEDYDLSNAMIMPFPTRNTVSTTTQSRASPAMANYVLGAVKVPSNFDEKLVRTRSHQSEWQMLMYDRTEGNRVHHTEAVQSRGMFILICCNPEHVADCTASQPPNTLPKLPARPPSP